MSQVRILSPRPLIFFDFFSSFLPKFLRLERVFVLKSKAQALAQEGNESAAELGPRKR